MCNKINLTNIIFLDGKKKYHNEINILKGIECNKLESIPKK